MKTKIDTKNVTLKTLTALKADIYARAERRIQQLKAETKDVRELSQKLLAVQKRADFDASRVAFVIRFVTLRA